MQLVPGSWSLSRRILYSPPFPPAEHTYASLPFCRISFYAISSCQKISRAKMLFCKLHSSSPSPLPPKKGNRLSGECRASAFVHKNFSSFPLSGCFILMSLQLFRIFTCQLLYAQRSQWALEGRMGVFYSVLKIIIFQRKIHSLYSLICKTRLYFLLGFL